VSSHNQSIKQINQTFISFVHFSLSTLCTYSCVAPTLALTTLTSSARARTHNRYISVCLYVPCHVISLSRSSPHLFVFTAYSLTHLQYSPYGDSHILSRCTKLFSPHFETKKNLVLIVSVFRCFFVLCLSSIVAMCCVVVSSFVCFFFSGFLCRLLSVTS